MKSYFVLSNINRLFRILVLTGLVLFVPRVSAVESLAFFEFFKGDPVSSLTAPVMVKGLKSKKIQNLLPGPFFTTIVVEKVSSVSVPAPLKASVIIGPFYSPLFERAPPVL